jgi:hypothetical protein
VAKKKATAKKGGKGKNAGKKKSAKKKAATGTPAVGAITIGVGNVITLVPDTIQVDPDSDLSFLIANQDDYDHQVWIDPGLVVNKGSGKKQNPFSGDIGKTNVPAGKSKAMTLRTKTKGGFPELPVTLKYTVESFTKGGLSSALDPDLDVVDPTATAHY